MAKSKAKKKGIWAGLDRMAGGFLPGGERPEDVTWRDTVGQWGDVAAKAAPAASFIPGVGWVATAALGAAGGLAGQLNDEDGFRGGLGDTIRGGVWGGLGGAGVDRLQGAHAAWQAGRTGAAAAQGGGAAAPGPVGGPGGSVPLGGPAPPVTGGVPQGGLLGPPRAMPSFGSIDPASALPRTGWAGLLDWGKDNADWLLPAGAAGANAWGQFREGQRLDEDLARRAPLRDAGMAGLLAMNSQLTPGADLHDIYSDPYNPFYRNQRGAI